jgi:uncharacterized membrane protein
MTWVQRYRLRHYLNDSVWVLPSVGIIAAIATARVGHAVDRALGWSMSLNPDAAQTVMITLASATFTFVVFVSSALLIALQLASAQLTPRIIALVFRDRAIKVALTLFVYTFTLAVAAALRIADWVPSFTVNMAAYSCVASLAVFLYLIDHIGKLLRPANALRLVALSGRDVIQSVYPLMLDQVATTDAGRPVETGRAPANECETVVSRKDGVLLACDIEGMVELGRRADCVLELVPQVGDYVARGDPLVRVYGTCAGSLAGSVRRMVAIGHERSLEQDPAFAFRIIVDIASKALSPAINDPTTAVLAIDQLQHLLGLVGRRHLDDERVHDATGLIRLFYRTPAWEDFVHLAVTEVRHYGSQSVQVSRRLRAMLESLLRVLPPQRAAALRGELELLNRSAVRSFAEPEDQTLAADSDCQGVGGRHVNDDDPGGAPAIREPGRSSTTIGAVSV